MTTENQDQPPCKPNPASSLPQQEKRWTVDKNIFYVRIMQSDTCMAVINGIHNEECAKQLCDAHNATLSEPKPEDKCDPKCVICHPSLAEPDAPAGNAQSVLQNTRYCEALKKIQIMTDGHPINADRRDRIHQICKGALS